MPWISELFPEPDAPVTQTNCSSGIATVMFFRLFCRAPRTTSRLPLGGRRRAGIAMRFFPLRYCPVSDFPSRRMALSGPSATMVPPCTPGPGPISRMWSAARMVSASCSTTITVLPRSRRRFSVSIIRTLSLGCSPMLGSSST